MFVLCEIMTEAERRLTEVELKEQRSSEESYSAHSYTVRLTAHGGAEGTQSQGNAEPGQSRQADKPGWRHGPGGPR